MGSREKASLSEEAHYEGLLYLGTVGYERLWGRASLLMGAELGKLEWTHLLGTLRDG
jgi:hypothetical protein